MKIKKKKKWKKDLEIPSFYTSVPKIVIIGYTVPEIWHRWIKLLFFILNYTFPFYTSCLLTAQKMKISKKWKKNPGDIIILQNCTKNHDHMLYCSWHMAHNRCNSYFSVCAIFCPLPPQQSEKWKFQKKPKKLEISSFYTSVPKIMIICYTVPEIWHVTHAIVPFHFRLFFALLPP